MTNPTGPQDPHPSGIPAGPTEAEYDPSLYGPYGQLLPGHPQYGQQPSYLTQPAPAPPGYPQPGSYPAPPPSSFQQPYPGGNFGGMPAYPGAPSAVEAPVATPPSVLYAFIAYLALMAVNVIMVIVVATTDKFDVILRASLLEEGLSASEIDSGMSMFRTIIYVMMAVVVGISLLFSLKMRAGRNWARIVLTVVSAFSLLSVFNAGQSTTVPVGARNYALDINPAFTYLAAALAVAGLVLMWLKASNEYFTAKRQEKARQTLGR